MKTQSFISKPTNSWITEASTKPIPKMLFGECWFENEVCVLFSDTNTGKSILAVQIADSISKGTPINGLKLEAEKQKVLYFDFELSDKQMELRYSDDYQNHYQFDDKFIRSEINTHAKTPLTANSICTQIEQEIIYQDAKIVIIDNLTYLSQDFEKANLALELMKHLKEMKTKYQLSILILAHTPKRQFDRPISNNDLQGSKMLMNFFDSAFAIGKSYSDNNLRYVKQIKQRNCEQIYSEDNILLFNLNKGKDNNFLSFHFNGFGSEYEHLNCEPTKNKEALKEEAKQLRLEGLTNDEVGKRLGYTEGTIRNWLK